MAAVPSIIEQVIDAHNLKGRRLPKVSEPLSIIPVENQLFTNINSRLEDLRELTTKSLITRLPEIERIVAVREDARRSDQDWVDLVAMILRNLTALSTIPEGKYLDLVRQPASETNQRNILTVQRQIKSLLGVDVFTGFDPRDVTTVNGMVRGAVAKIKSVEAQYFADVEELVIREFRAGTRHEKVGELITERFKVSQSRGRLIARDQVNKLNGALTQQRQTRLGVTHYFWRTVGDERVRPSHRALNGKRFAWNKPPAVGHPGEPIACRCHADPDLEGLLE